MLTAMEELQQMLCTEEVDLAATALEEVCIYGS